MSSMKLFIAVSQRFRKGSGGCAMVTSRKASAHADRNEFSPLNDTEAWMLYFL